MASIDRDEISFVAHAEHRWRTRAWRIAVRSEWICGDAAGELECRRVDAALCIEASHALGGLTPCLGAIGAKLARGGHLMYGDGS